jgi:hypothetical protein
MASVNIPEEIIGVPLFVPSANNFFQIDVGGMPNGDDCLSVLGATSRDHKAFMPAPATTPAIGVDGTRFAMSFWISGPTSGWLDSIIMSIENASASADPANTSSSNRVMSLYASAANGQLSISRGSIVGGSQGARYRFFAGCGQMPGPADWRFVVINFPSNETGFTWNDDNVVATGSDYQDLALAVGDQFLSIGGYANAIGANVDYRIGKIAFHDDWLDATQRLALFNAMTNP